MKKFLSILALALFFSGNAYADDSYETAFKKALDNHQYYFKHKGKNYTTDTKDKKFDFFDHGYKDYRSAAKYMVENYPNDKSSRCFRFKGKKWSFGGKRINKDSDKFYTYLDYDIDGWQNKLLTKSNNGKIELILYLSNGCYRQNSYFKIFFENKEAYDSRSNFFEGREHLKDVDVSLNINHYIDKDLNKNGKQELFIDAGYAFGMPWNESYYLFEYDENSIELVKNFIAGDWTQRLGISDHFKAKFEVSDDELANVIYKNFSESEYVECIEGDCINGKGIFDGKNGIKYVGEFKDGKYHGQGTETFQNRFKYVGEFKDGLHHGRGILIYIFEGDKYVGEFKDGAQEGQGTYTYSDGDKYIGEWKDGLYNGQGTLTYADGDKYIGGWKNSRKTGQGTLTYADGTKFTGEWNEYDGIFTHTDGTKFVGEWDWKRDGKPIIDKN